MGPLNVRRTLPKQTERLDGVTPYHAQFNAYHSSTFALFDRLHVLPTRLSAITRRWWTRFSSAGLWPRRASKETSRKVSARAVRQDGIGDFYSFLIPQSRPTDFLIPRFAYSYEFGEEKPGNLFIQEIKFPQWLKIDSTEELETNLIGVTVVVLAVNFMGAVFVGGTDNLLRYGAGIDLPIAALGLFIYPE
jgi:hypothetical protein